MRRTRTWLRCGGPAKVTAMITSTIAALALAGCGGDDPPAQARATTDSPAPTSPAAQSSEPASAGDGSPILIRTSINGLAGKVLATSQLGESTFCARGTVRHDHGSPELGFPAVNVFHCSDGDLKIGFGPGPDQMNDSFQTSDWKILEGTGRYAATTGQGQMVVKFEAAGVVKGEETFVGRVVP
jgi:hypothetical protein